MGINVNIVAGPTGEESSINVTGSVEHIITDTEVETFHITDGKLKDAVKAYFGLRPDDTFLHSPTPWGDLYKTYGWSQVKCVLRVKSARITGVDSKPTIISSKTMRNTSDHKAIYATSISETVQDTVQAEWSMAESVSVEQEIKYDAEFLGVGGGGSTKFGFSMEFGLNGGKSTSTEVGSSSEIKVELAPGQSVDAQLTASRGTLTARIVYEAYLTGNVAINYSSPYKGHHFWALGIDGVMRSADISNSIEVTEDIEVGYYSNGTIILKATDGQPTKSLRGILIPDLFSAKPAR